MKRIALYCFYDRDGIADSETYRQLRQLQRAADEIIIIINGAITDESCFDCITRHIVKRENLGYDAGAYREVFCSEHYRQMISGCDELIVCNNSFYGPFLPLTEIFAQMDGSKADFWGITSSEKNLVEHVQSYFLVFRKPVLNSDILFRYFREKISGALGYDEVCSVFENGLFNALTEQGYRYDALVKNISCDLYVNPVGSLLLDHVPIVKKKVFYGEFYQEEKVKDVLACLFHLYGHAAEAVLENLKKRYGYNLCITEIQNRHVQEKLHSDISQIERLIPKRRIMGFIKKAKKIFIYGTDSLAMHVYRSVISIPGNPSLEGFIVPKGKKTDREKLYGYPTFAPEELRQRSSKAHILICVEEGQAGEAYKQLSGMDASLLCVWKQEDTLEDYSVSAGETLQDGYWKMQSRQSRILFVKDDEGHYLGEVTKEILEGSSGLSGDTLIARVYNQEGIYVKKGVHPLVGKAIFKKAGMDVLPLVDEEERLVGICREKDFCTGHEEQTGMKKGWVFPYSRIKAGSRIVLYGAGTIGRAFKEQIDFTGYCEMVLWVDQDAWRLFPDGTVSPPEHIAYVSYDCILIAIKDPLVSVSAVKALQDMGISKKRLVPIADVPDNGFDFQEHHKTGKKISFVIPSPVAGSGGNRTFLRFMKSLSERGHQVTAYVCPETLVCKDIESLERDISEHFFDLQIRLVIGTDAIEPCDILIATYWKSAYVVKENSQKARMSAYFIQDIESYFHPMGYDFIEAYMTYQLGLVPITYGPKVKYVIENEFHEKKGVHFDFSINADVYFAGNGRKRKKRILYGARPELARRCYPLGIKALKLVKERNQDVEIYFYGAEREIYGEVPFDFVDCGILSPDALGELYRESLLGLCFSTTNPSLIPYEMMRCGLPVVDIDFDNNSYNYGGFDNVLLARPTPEGVAEAMISLIENPNLWDKRSENGIVYTRNFLDDATLEEEMEKKLLERYGEEVNIKGIQ